MRGKQGCWSRAGRGWQSLLPNAWEETLRDLQPSKMYAQGRIICFDLEDMFVYNNQLVVV